MYPEVPIALRMSGHLLLGVVRIYSKKVDYLYQDYNFFLISIRKAFVSVKVNLPEDATHAPFHSITLPDIFDLNALNSEDFYHEGVQDNHLRSLEDITLTDQIPTGRDPFIAITIDKENLKNFVRSEEASDLGAMPMEEDSHLSIPLDPIIDFGHAGPSNQIEASERINKAIFLESIPEIEVMRDAARDLHVNNIPCWPDQGKDVIEPDGTLEQQLLNDKEMPTPAAEILSSGGKSIPSHHRVGTLNSPASYEAHDISYSPVAFEHASPKLVIRSTPPVGLPPVEQPRGRRRKRKQPFDESTVLVNKFIKTGLDNYSDLQRRKKHCPSSALDIWKSNNSLRKENIFVEPLIPGLCADLSNIYKGEFVSSKPYLVSVEEACPVPSGAQSPPPMRDTMRSPDMEVEHLRNFEGNVDSYILSEIIGSPSTFMPSQTGFMCSQRIRNDFTPASPGNLGSESEPQPGTTIGTGVLPTPDLTSSTGTLGSEMETPMTFFGEPLGLDNTGLSDIPEVMNSAEADDLNFLASGDYTPSEVQVIQGIDTLPGATRKVAQYLKEKSSVTPISEDLCGDLVLNKLLEGKSRKVSARMFSETLVLKCYGLVDVQQEEPYGDIALKLTPKLFKDMD